MTFHDLAEPRSMPISQSVAHQFSAIPAISAFQFLAFSALFASPT
jgi:hypothetical protein